MKINIKDKKVILSIAGVFLAGVIVANILYSKINTAQNEFVSIQSVLYNIKDNTLDRKKELLLLQESMMKLNEDKEKSIKIDQIIAAIENNDYKVASKINDNIVKLDELNEEIDKMIDMYNNNENMKKDMTIANAMVDIEGLDNNIEGIMEEHNNEYTEKFNKVIKKFPVNIVAKKKGWYDIDKFSSIN